MAKKLQFIQDVTDPRGNVHSVLIYGKGDLRLGNMTFASMRDVKAHLLEQYPDDNGRRELSPDEPVAEGDFVEWSPGAWTTVDHGSEYIGDTPQALGLRFQRAQGPNETSPTFLARCPRCGGPMTTAGEGNLRYSGCEVCGFEDEGFNCSHCGADNETGATKCCGCGEPRGSHPNDL